MHKKFYFENLNEKDPIQDLEIDGRVIWKEVIKKYGMMWRVFVKTVLTFHIS